MEDVAVVEKREGFSVDCGANAQQSGGCVDALEAVSRAVDGSGLGLGGVVVVGEESEEVDSQAEFGGEGEQVGEFWWVNWAHCGCFGLSLCSTNGMDWLLRNGVEA